MERLKRGSQQCQENQILMRNELANEKKESIRQV